MDFKTEQFTVCVKNYSNHTVAERLDVLLNPNDRSDACYEALERELTWDLTKLSLRLCSDHFLVPFGTFGTNISKFATRWRNEYIPGLRRDFDSRK